MRSRRDARVEIVHNVVPVRLHAAPVILEDGPSRFARVLSFPCCPTGTNPANSPPFSGTSQVLRVVGLEPLPLHAADAARARASHASLSSLRSVFSTRWKSSRRPRCRLALHGHRDADPDLNAEDVVGRARQFRVVPDVALQVQVVDPREILEQMLPHPVERDLIDEAVVGDEAHDAVPPVQPIHRPAEELHVHVAQGVLVRGGRILGVGLAHAPVNYLVLAVLVVVVLVELPCVVGRVADHHGDRRLALPLDACDVLLAS